MVWGFKLLQHPIAWIRSSWFCFCSFYMEMEMHWFLLVVESLPHGSNIAELATAKVENVQRRIYIYIYLEPKWPIIILEDLTMKWKVNPQKRGQLGSRYIYIYLLLTNVHGKMFGANPGFRKYVVFKLHWKYLTLESYKRHGISHILKCPHAFLMLFSLINDLRRSFWAI